MCSTKTDNRLTDEIFMSKIFLNREFAPKKCKTGKSLFFPEVENIKSKYMTKYGQNSENINKHVTSYFSILG